jgi:acylphosphatase
MIEVRCIVYGNVQRVGFRDYVQTEAKSSGVTGWIRNESDGTVLVIAQGTPDALRYFIEVLHEGSVLARVSEVAVEWGSPQQLFTDFVVKY